MAATDDPLTPRLHQFLIEHYCTVSADPQMNAEFQKEYPEGYPVWVSLEPGPEPHEPNCHGKTFRMTEESARDFFWSTGVTSSTEAIALLVCEHMGHLIE